MSVFVVKSVMTKDYCLFYKLVVTAVGASRDDKKTATAVAAFISRLRLTRVRP